MPSIPTKLPVMPTARGTLMVLAPAPHRFPVSKSELYDDVTLAKC
jgi:hypothetical protein